MNTEEAIKRLCSLITEVGDEVYKHEYAHDCICGYNPIGNRVDEPVIKFIEDAVRSKILDQKNIVF